MTAPLSSPALWDELEKLAAAAGSAALGEVDGTTIPVPVEDCRLIGRALPSLLSDLRRYHATTQAVSELADEFEGSSAQDHSEGKFHDEDADCVHCAADEISAALSALTPTAQETTDEH